MFKFLHTADIHLDSPLRGLSDREGAPADTIRGATRKALSSLVSLAIEREVDFVLIAGDIYDGDWPDFNTGLFFNQQMSRLNQVNIPVYLISGNHDAASKITKSLKPPSNVHVLSTKSPESLQLEGLPVTIHGQGFATPSVSENLALSYPEPTQDHFNIGMLHTSLAGDPRHDSYAPCSLSDLTDKGYDYWALGHIHLHAVHHENPHVIYSGNPQGRHINETGERGCYLIEVDSSRQVSKLSFEVTDSVRWESIEVELPQRCDDEPLRALLRQSISDALANAEGRLLALRLVLTGATSLHDRLHAEQSKWQAECVNIADEIDRDLIWIESLKVQTRPTYDPNELATRDELTRLVIEALDDYDPASNTPPSIDQLNDKLKAIDDPELDALLDPKGRDQDFKDEVAAIVLNSIATSANTNEQK